MKILALDTSTEACSAALYIDGELISKYQLAPREHSRLILQMIDNLLAQADITVSALNAIAFGRGPGSFMGLRIAAGVVQGIAFSHDIPVVPISTLKAIAQRAFEQSQGKNVLAAIDARMDEVYWAAYTLEDSKKLVWKPLAEECVTSPDNINLTEMLSSTQNSWVAAGSGWASYESRLLAGNDFSPQEILLDVFPGAEQIVKLAVEEINLNNTVSAAEAIPIYLRNDVAKKPKPMVF